MKQPDLTNPRTTGHLKSPTHRSVQEGQAQGSSEAAQSIRMCRQPLRTIGSSARVSYHHCSVGTIRLQIGLKRIAILSGFIPQYLASLSIPEEGVQEGTLVHVRRLFPHVHRLAEDSMWPIHKSVYGVKFKRRRADIMEAHQASHRPDIYSRVIYEVEQRRETIEDGLRRPNVQRRVQLLGSFGTEKRYGNLVSSNKTQMMLTNLLPSRLS
jgi:hypothetical protein